ncbi:MAG: DNA cytosine methyltransferase, partial [Synergistaceae bacterium]|nr:DNA cytosine methyltransferase [Synergistaceae bacterium]
AADDVCTDLERQGYEVGIFNYEAAVVGAPHRRERVFFVAHAGRALLQRGVKQGTLQNEIRERTADKPERPSRQWKPEPRLDRVAYGIPNRLDRLRALGNAVVPQQVYPIFKAIMELN